MDVDEKSAIHTVSASTVAFLQRLRAELDAPLCDPPIASSGHSAVYRTHSKLYGRDVAVKVINRKALHKSIADKFLPRELQVTVTEFYPNGTLLSLVVAEGGIEEVPRGAHIFRQLTEAVYYLHSRGFVHRDIKPENIMIDANGDIRLGDFGFARGMERRERYAIVANAPYDAFASDWFAMGVVLYTMITGKWPQEPVSARTTRFAPPKIPTPACCSLILGLLEPDESLRANYDVIINSEWLSQRPKWIFASSTHVYEVIPQPAQCF